MKGSVGEMDLVRSHYGRFEVREEIAEYCRGRWVAVHCEKLDDRGVRVMVRYGRGSRKPLTINSEADVLRILEEFRDLRPRSFYATAHSYSRLTRPEDTLDRGNMISSMPTWDIDSKNGDWRKVVEKAEEIVEVLEKLGVVESVFFKWSGRGAHIHIHGEAFSPEIRRKIDPLDISYSITQYVINRLSPSSGVVVENKIDLQRVFTTPLSLHRILDRVAVCLKPERISEFDISWTHPRSFKHDPSSWRRYVVGEGDELAERAFGAIGPYIVGRIRRRRKHKPLDKQILDMFKRFDSRL
ncbi:MAG: hypothetical protein B6U65_02175 [Candidatus Wolframiiraptor sp. EX4484-121]|nr:MAG: hypothetical protein B6U65_02175 [Candidatus Wolframiiraptor sp. EX4484-121]